MFRELQDKRINRTALIELLGIIWTLETHFKPNARNDDNITNVKENISEMLDDGLLGFSIDTADNEENRKPSIATYIFNLRSELCDLRIKEGKDQKHDVIPITAVTRLNSFNELKKEYIKICQKEPKRAMAELSLTNDLILSLKSNVISGTTHTYLQCKNSDEKMEFVNQAISNLVTSKKFTREGG